MTCAVRSFLFLAITFTVILFQARPGGAFHSGAAEECQECHVGSSSALRGSDESSTCLRCHQAPPGTRQPVGYYVATNIGDIRAGMPPSQLTPGGDFAYLRKNYSWKSNDGRMGRSPGERHGHNITAIDYGYRADTTHQAVPGGSYPSAGFSCVSCHDPHETMTSADSGGAYRLLGGAGYSPRAAKGMAFRFGPPIAVAPRDYNRSESVTDTRVAYGRGMSEWCSNCHTTGDGHPSGSGAKLSAEILSNYNSYVGSGDMSGSGGASYTSLVPFEEGTGDATLLAQHAKSNGSDLQGPTYPAQVMCLTCHRAHASGWDHSGRWNMASDFIVYNNAYPGTDNGAPPEYARGRTAAETQKALYDRPVTRFSGNQRGLCNKCHIRD